MFVVTSRLRFASTTRASFPSMPSIEITGGGKNQLLVAVITIIILILLLLTSQELIHWLIPVGLRVSVVDFDINYGVSPSFP